MWSCHASRRRAWIKESFINILRRIYIIILGASLFGYPLTIVANLKGSQRQSVYQETFKSCMKRSAQSALQLDRSEHKRWCTCYSTQVVDNITPYDLERFAARNYKAKRFAARNYKVTLRMYKVADDANNYCKRKLY